MAELKTCRICLDPGDDLLSVCGCCGTARWVHKDCIEKWVLIRQEHTCEICHGDYDFTQMGIVVDEGETGETEETDETTRSGSVGNLALWTSCALSVSQSIAAFCSIRFNPNPIMDVISMSIWFNMVHLILWVGHLSRDENPFSVSIIWIMGSAIPFTFLQIFGDTFDSPASILFLETNIMTGFVGTLCGVCVMSDV